ncbi:class I SAM-dependent methyltransferase [Candidatus Pelagibacter sp.]|nr:class I SAM-dependent methyltransferase [Candidatus Pelagibacter sp.]OCW76650.1 methyltransferase [Pelagibacteraceae bacterium GOM-A1]
MKYNYYWRKSGLKKPYGDNFLSLVEEYKPKNVLEIGVFCGVTSRNICELLKTNFGSDFRYYGLDLFGSSKTSSVDEIEPKFLENQKFSNPLKTIYYNFIKKENLNSKISVQNFLKKFSQNIELIEGDTRVTLEKIPLSEIDFVFLDGGHSYDTVLSDLQKLYDNMKNNSKIVCDDFAGITKIESVEKAIKDFANNNKIKLEEKFKRFALLNVEK